MEVNDKTIRVLHVITGMGSGGAESVIINWYRNIDRSKIQFDFLLRSEENIYKEEIESLGGRIFIMPSYPNHYLKNYIKTKRFFKEHEGEFSAIHVHANALLYVNVFNLAKKYKIKTRIMHSHNTKSSKKFYAIFHKINKLSIKKKSTLQLACSNEAGQWMFNDNFTVINNGIDLEKFRFNALNREELKKELNIENKFVVGHIGRFLPSKNHLFLIDVFNEVIKLNKNIVLLLFGSGPLENEVKLKVKKYGLENNILFMGVKKDIYKYYSAFDLFVFPSLFEGLGIVAIEAQANGLKCLLSDTITREVDVSNDVSFLSINNGIKCWVDAIIEFFSVESVRKVYDMSSFDIKNTTKEMEKIYLENVND